MANTTVRQTGGEYQATVNAGDTLTFILSRLDSGRGPVTVGVKPAGGASALVEHSLSPAANVEAGTGEFHAWPAGTVTAYAEDVIDGPVTALKFTATVAGTVQINIIQ